jgi:hypothetical protein
MGSDQESRYLCHGFSFIGLGLISFIGLVSKRTSDDSPFFFYVLGPTNGQFSRQAEHLLLSDGLPGWQTSGFLTTRVYILRNTTATARMIMTYVKTV